LCHFIKAIKIRENHFSSILSASKSILHLYQITKSSNPQIIKSPNHQIPKSSNCQIIKSPNHPTAMHKVLIAAAISAEFQQFLNQQNCICITDDFSAETIASVHGIITSTKLKIDKQFIDQATQLQWIARLGSGLEIIDTQYAATKNIYCCSSPAGIANAVAEHVIALLINLQKNIVRSANQVQQYQWIREPNRGWELEGKTFGIIGFGHTGTAVADKLAVFNCNVIAYDKYKDVQHATAASCTLDYLYAHADVVSYHLPQNAETIGYYQASLFAKQHILINTSRGAIAPTANILAGLQSKQLWCAGLDVLDFENNYPFCALEQQQLQTLLDYGCIITPHIAGYSFNAIQKMSAELVNQLKQQVFYE
jgi:D-3-phosphoglycerate dehydrogenase / 2-oxoglutarate reductase